MAYDLNKKPILTDNALVNAANATLISNKVTTYQPHYRIPQ